MSEISKGAIIQFYASEQSSSLLYLFYSLLLLWQGQITDQMNFYRPRVSAKIFDSQSDQVGLSRYLYKTVN